VLIFVLAAGLIAAFFINDFVKDKFRNAAAADSRNTDGMIRVVAGKEFIITLKGNATTGYEWQLAGPIDEGLIKLIHSEYVPYRTGLVGSGGRSIWCFKAVGTGKTRISFKYIRPWEKGATPLKKAVYAIDVKK